MIKRSAKEVQYFFYSQAFADGFRASFAILFPSLIASYLGYFQLGLSISLGALCVSISDAPGPILHKRNGMLFCAMFIFLIALITPFASKNFYTMAMEIVAVTFFFSMFNVYGNRASGVGNAAILMMILTMDTPLATSEIFIHAILIFSIVFDEDGVFVVFCKAGA